MAKREKSNGNQNAFKHGMSRHPMYKVAERIIARCNNKQCKDYKDYGAIGVKCLIGESIVEVASYLIGMPGWFEGATVDRINSFGNYEHGNLRWADKRQQRINQRGFRGKIDYGNGTKPTPRGSFKKICKNNGWDFDDFEEIDSGEKSGYNKKYYYELKK